jgi:multidrug efflux pump subunit AcrB
VTVNFIDFQDRSRPSEAILADLQETVGKDLAGAIVKVEALQEGPSQGLPVNIEITGDDPIQLKALSDRVISILQRDAVFPKLVGLASDLDEARPELAVYVDREKAALYDLSTSKIGRAIRAAINGVEAAKYRTGNDEYDIIVRLAEPYRAELEQLRDLTVMDEGRQIPLLSVANWEVADGYGSIKRKDQTRMATIGAGVAEGYNSNAILVEVQAALSDFGAEIPPGYEVRYTGQSQDQDEAMAFLGTAFATALGLYSWKSGCPRGQEETGRSWS